MRIAIFHNLPSGGAKRALHGFAKILSQKQHELDLFIPSSADETFLSLSSLMQQKMVFPLQKTFRGLFSSAWNYVLPVRFSAADLDECHRKIAEVINSGSYDVVLVEQDRYTQSPFLLKYLKRPSLYFCQQPSRLEESALTNISLQSTKNHSPVTYARKLWKGYLRKRLPAVDRANARWAKYILANSAFSQHAIQKAYGLNASVCHLGIDPGIFRPLHQDRKNFVLSVGSMEPSKGYDFLIHALANVDQARRPKLIIVSNSGNERYAAWIEGLARSRSVEVEQKRLVSDEELVQLYNEAALFLYAPYSEPLGLAALEAMACGTPALAVKEGGISETVEHDRTGILTGRDEKEFAAAMEMLLRDQNKCETLRQNASQSIKDYWTIEHATDRLLKHMQNAIALQKI